MTTSAVASVSPSSLTSQVSTRTLSRPRSAAFLRIFSRWVELLDTAVMRDAGYCSAIHSVSEPQPQPSSSTSWPSTSSARSQVSRSIAASASGRVWTPRGHRALEYFRCGPSISSKKRVGTS